MSVGQVSLSAERLSALSWGTGGFCSVPSLSAAVLTKEDRRNFFEPDPVGVPSLSAAVLTKEDRRNFFEPGPTCAVF